jgi:hypothetical protein
VPGGRLALVIVVPEKEPLDDLAQSSLGFLAGQAQRFLSAHDQINNLFHLRRDHVTAAEHKAARRQTFQVWAEICGIG